MKNKILFFLLTSILLFAKEEIEIKYKFCKDVYLCTRLQYKFSSCLLTHSDGSVWTYTLNCKTNEYVSSKIFLYPLNFNERKNIFK